MRDVKAAVVTNPGLYYNFIRPSIEGVGELDTLADWDLDELDEFLEGPNYFLLEGFGAENQQEAFYAYRLKEGELIVARRHPELWGVIDYLEKLEIKYVLTSEREGNLGLDKVMGMECGGLHERDIEVLQHRQIEVDILQTVR